MEFEISLNDLTFYAYHGVLEEERKIGNKFIVNLTVCIPVNIRPVLNDEIESTISYVELYKIVDSIIQRPCELLEKVTLEIALKIKETFPQVIRGHINVEKDRPPIPGMLGSACVGLNF